MKRLASNLEALNLKKYIRKLNVNILSLSLENAIKILLRKANIFSELFKPIYMQIDLVFSSYYYEISLLVLFNDFCLNSAT